MFIPFVLIYNFPYFVTSWQISNQTLKNRLSRSVFSSSSSSQPPTPSSPSSPSSTNNNNSLPSAQPTYPSAIWPSSSQLSMLPPVAGKSKTKCSSLPQHTHLIFQLDSSSLWQMSQLNLQLAAQEPQQVDYQPVYCGSVKEDTSTLFARTETRMMNN